MSDPTDHQDPPFDDAAIDARLRAAGARLRGTAPDRTQGSADRIRPGSSRRRWYAGGVAVGAAAAAVIALIVLPGGDETVRQAPADTAPDTAPDTTPDTEPEDDPVVPATTTAPTTTAPSTTEVGEALPDPGVRLVIEESLDDWDDDGGICLTLEVDEPQQRRFVPMCLRGDQLAATAVAYVRGDHYAYGWSATRGEDGELAQVQAGGVDTDPGTIDHPTLPDAPCGPPEHDLPPDQWVLVSHCTAGAALYTLPPSAPGGPSAVSVGTVHGPEVRLAMVADTLELDAGEDGARTGRVELIDVAPLEIGGITADCVLVAPAGASTWTESCQFGDEPVGHGLLAHRGQAFLLEQIGRLRLVPIESSAVLRTHGCSTPAGAVLDALADPDGLLAAEPGLLVTGLACSAAESPFDNPAADRYASARFSGVLLRSGPVDGGLVELERGDDGWTVVDTGTGLEPEVWPLPIPTAEEFSVEADLLPPVDVTATLRSEVGEAASTDALIGAISAYLIGLHEPEAGDPPDAVPMAGGLPTSPGRDRVGRVAAELRYLDDSTSSGAYSIWLAEPDDGRPVTIERAFVTNRCARGVTESDGVLLCV